MDINLLQLLRFIHIVAGSVWVGTAVTMGFFVLPVLLTGNPATAAHLKQIMLGRKLAMFLPLSMVLVVLSGGYLYWLDFPNMAGATFDRRALDYTLGAFLGILAAIVGVFVTMPTGMKLGAIVDSIGSGAPSAGQSNELARLSRKMLIGARSNAVLLLGAVALMALARYAR